MSTHEIPDAVSLLYAEQALTLIEARKQIQDLVELLKDIDRLAKAALWEVGSGSKDEFLKDIRYKCSKVTVPGGLITADVADATQ